MTAIGSSGLSAKYLTLKVRTQSETDYGYPYLKTKIGTHLETDKLQVRRYRVFYISTLHLKLFLMKKEQTRYFNQQLKI